MVASAFPLAQVALKAAEDKAAAEARAREGSEGDLPSVGDLPFIPSEGGSLSPESSGANSGLGLGGASSLLDPATLASQNRAGASGSVLLTQVLGAAELMGYPDVAIPELPVGKVAAVNPLRAAILGWIDVTGAVVPPDELARELLRADAMPIEVQRDIALLLVSATEATILQGAALSKLTPAELKWVYDHPEIGEDLAAGVNTPETRTMAALAGLVDMEKSIAASLLMLKAIEATRGSLSTHEAAKTIDALNGRELDATTRAILDVLATAQADLTDSQKVMMAAQLVSLTSGVEVPAQTLAPSFSEALDALLAASAQTPSAASLAQTLERADALPADLQGAIARIVLAEAAAIKAANPAHLTPTSQPQALAGVLVATAQALPVLEKYGFYWSATPDALRMGEWDPSTRLGWAAHHAALVATARNDITDLAAVAPVLSGHAYAGVPQVPERSFVDAYLAVSKESGFTVSDAQLAEIQQASAALDPAVRDAAAILMSGVAESARLQAIAFADLAPEEISFLRFEVDGLDALYTASSVSEADLARLQRAASLASRVDADALAQAGVVATLATIQADRVLEGADAFQTQSAVSHVATGFRGLIERLFPSAKAQGPQNTCLFGTGFYVSCDPENDVLLRIEYPDLFTSGFTPGEYAAYAQMMNETWGTPVRIGPGETYVYTCDSKECSVYDPTPFNQNARYPLPTPGEATHDLLVITGTESKTYRPAIAPRVVCAAATNNGIHSPSRDCRAETAYRYGAATISLDLGGDDNYQLPVGMVHANATLPVSIHLDVGGADRYTDPSVIYDAHTPILRDLGYNAGHPTQASAVYGGVAILVDAQGEDRYDAPTRSQGYGRLGLALLADLSADNELYSGRDYVQGASSETFTLGGGILFDRQGTDEYTAKSGQGYGLGSVIFDLGGQDIYRNENAPLGIPVVHLDIIPGGDLTALDTRRDNSIWLDGPGSINVGIGIDQELLLTTADADSDFWPDVAEFVVGTDRLDPADNPQTHPTARAEEILVDTDGDGYYDYIENALSSDPNNPTSYPAGLPRGVAVNIPSGVWSQVAGIGVIGIEDTTGIEDGHIAPFELLGNSSPTGDNFTGSDKIIDLRLPVQNAGTIDYACTGEFYPNATLPLVGYPGSNDLMALPLNTSEDPVTGGPARDADGSVLERCLYLSYDPSGPGQGNATLPQSDDSQGQKRGDQFSYQIPVGILAVGDVVSTTYSEDYFVIIDLGGSDRHWKGSGGALAVTTSPILAEGQQENDGGALAVTSSFIAPGVSIGIDISVPTAQGTIESGGFNDLYWNASRDFAHGSYFGVLVDTAGVDSYIARDGSQGTMGGVLLDLDGIDVYSARHLSQGAGLAATPKGGIVDAEGSQRRPVADMPNGGQLPGDSQGRVTGDEPLRAHRRMLPGILLDFGAPAAAAPAGLASWGNTFTSIGSHSQGFARGYPQSGVDQEDAPSAYGILASLGEGVDTYNSAGRYAQGVGGVDGVGILLDRGGADRYLASSVVSHGATIPQRVGTQDAEMNGQPRPATGILVDLGGNDTYTVKTQKHARHDNNNLSVERSESASSQSAGRVFLDLGIHLDTEVGGDPLAALNGLVGAGDQQAIDAAAFYVYMPSARLAVGKEGNTSYTKDFAFVVDLGGANTYVHNAGGLIRDAVGEYYATGSTELPTGVYDAQFSLFPVSIVVDAGTGGARVTEDDEGATTVEVGKAPVGSTYRSDTSFTQGAGFFGVGIVADLSGRDVFEIDSSGGEGLASTWIQPAPHGAPPIVDGTIGTDWDFVPAQPITLTSLDDPRFSSAWSVRVANDGDKIYLGLSGSTMSPGEGERLRDELVIDLDMGRRSVEWDYKANRTGIDQVVVRYDRETKRCTAEDRAWNDTYVPDAAWAPVAKGFTKDNVPSGRLAVECRFTDDGQVFYEISKKLVVDFPYDFRDLAYCYDETVGFGAATNKSSPTCEFPVNELGLFLRFMDHGAGYYEEGTGTGCTSTNPCPEGLPFTWPPGAVDEDGAYGAPKTLNLTEEMRDWGSIGLAQVGEDGVRPANLRAPTFTQGAGLAGVGIVALLGTGLSESQMVGFERTQGYGAYGGLGLVLDTSGSDVYVSDQKSLGAAENRGLGLFVDLEGNDNYISRNATLGWSPGSGTPTATSAFLDLGGDDRYEGLPTTPTAWVKHLRNGFRQATPQPSVAPAGNNVMWVQNGSAGADYRFLEAARAAIGEQYVQNIARTDVRTTLNVTVYDPANPGPWGNGCTRTEVPTFGGKPGGPDHPDFIVEGKVCFVATVNTSGGAFHTATQNALAGVAPTVKGSPVEEAFRELTLAAAGVTSAGVLDRTVDVMSVDFLIDRARVSTTYDVEQIGTGLSRWAAVVDLSDFPDGAARAKALPLFAANIQGYGAYLFADSVDDDMTETVHSAAKRFILIDNPSMPKVDLQPEYTGIASATYSPFAVGAKQNLLVNYTVNHDVGEDRLAQFNAFRAPVYNSSIPCDGMPAIDAQDVQLCNILPFYIGNDGEELTTTPGDEAGIIVGDEKGASYFFGPPTRMHREQLDSTHDSALPVLNTNLVIRAKESFHLALPGRTTLLPQVAPRTEIHIFLKTPDGEEVLSAPGQKWFLANHTRGVGSTLPAVNTDAAFNALGNYGGNLKKVTDILGAENSVRQAVNTTYIQICGNSTQYASTNYSTPQCRQLTGRWGASGGSADLCGPGHSNDLVGRLIYPAWNSVNNVTLRGDVEYTFPGYYPSPLVTVPRTQVVNEHVIDPAPGQASTCRHIYNDLNQTSDQYGAGGVSGTLGEVTNLTVETVNGVLADARLPPIGDNTKPQGGVNFTDFYFDVNPRLPTGNHCKGGASGTECIRFENGNLVIPSGYKIQMEFKLLPNSTCVLELCDQIQGAFYLLGDQVLDVTDQANDVSPVDLYDPTGTGQCGDQACFDPIHDTVVEGGIRQRGEAIARALSGTSQLNFLPASYFFVKSGEPHQQARLEMRVPAEPTTNVRVTIDNAITGVTAVDLRSGGLLAGDVPGTPTRTGGYINPAFANVTNESNHVNWSANIPGMRWTQNTITYTADELPDGLYDVTVHAGDRGDSRITTKSDRLLVDKTPAQTLVMTDVFTGKAALKAGAIPVRWSVLETGSGLKDVYLYTRDGDSGDLRTGWQGPIGPFPPGTREYLKSKNASETTYLFATIAIDRAGNVEGVKSTIDDPIPNETVALQRAFLAKVALGANVPGGYRRVLLDQGEPLYSAAPKILGGKLVNYQGSVFTFVRAGVPVTFSVCALDLEDEIGLVRLNLDHVDPLTGVLSGIQFNATAGEPCEEGGIRYSSTEWHLVNQDSARFAEGIWSATFDLFDRAGNRLPVSAGNVVLDHESPAVKLEAPVLPAGQSAVKPGDVVKIRLLANDDFGVDENGIRVDASAFAKNASALKTRAVRVNGVVFQEATFTVDLPGIKNGVFNLSVSVPDFAGNATVVKTTIAVDYKPFEFVNGSLKVTDIKHNSVTLRWKTTEPTSALARFGTSAVSLTGRTPQDINATIEHALKVEGLQPSTHYFLRAVAVSAGGLTKDSEIVEVDTSSALFLKPVSPVSGDKVSGMVKVQFAGGLFDSTDFVSYTLEVRDGATKPWAFVTTATRQGDAHELNWNSTRFLDGKAYELRLTAKAGRDEAVLVIDRLTSDNTPPSVLVLAPLLATNDTTPLLTAEASDALSGLKLGPAKLLVDGFPVAKNVSFEPLPGGRLRFTYQFDTPLAAGMRELELQVQDLAGNTARSTWKVAIDGDAPVIKKNPTRFSPGTEAAKKGGTVTLNLTIEDLSGIANATADMSGLNPAAGATRLVKLVNTEIYQATISVTASEGSASKVVVVRAIDHAGNVAFANVDVPVDNIAPLVAATSLAEVKHRKAVIDVPANEPILVNGTASGPASIVTSATRDLATTARLTFDGLLPSRTYTFKLTAMDRAGNPVDLAGSFATLQDTVPPSALGDLSVLDLLNGTLRLTWAPATDDVLVAGYKVYRSDDGITFRVVGETQANVFEDWGLPYEKTYTYKVAAVDFGANEGQSSPALKAAATAVPHLTVGAVTPTVGTTSTTFRYTVTYLSPGGVPPAYVRVILDGVPQNMTLESGDAKTGAVYVYETRLAPHKRDAPHTYAFETSDGRYTVRFPDAGEVVRGPLVGGGDLLGSEESTGLAGFAQRVPLGGVGALALAIVAAAGIAALLRRKKEGSK